MSTIIIEKLGVFFESGLREVVRCWVASALLKESGWQDLEDCLPENTDRKYIIGIDLPTPVDLLKIINQKLSNRFDARIYKPAEGTFHPKVYLFECRDGSFKAIIGSANLTSGGLIKNTELNILTDDTDTCTEIKIWFERLFADAFPVSEENISRYEKHWLTYQPIDSTFGSIPNLVLQREQAVRNEQEPLDFSDRFFKLEHHDAFHKNRWFDSSKNADNARKAVADMFADLHLTIYGKFKSYGLDGLHPNQLPHLVSMHYRDPQKFRQRLNAMWLSYGKSPEEIKAYHKEYKQPFLNGQDQEDDKQSFINHARLQVRIEYRQIGIWILFAKNNGGGVVDRNVFKERMRLEPGYRLKFYELLKELPAPYWISVADDQRPIGYFNNADELYRFCRKDNENCYFSIGRDYQINDQEMSEDALPTEVLKVFALLYPLYRHMRHYII